MVKATDTMCLSDIRRRLREGVPVDVLGELNGCTVAELVDVLGVDTIFPNGSRPKDHVKVRNLSKLTRWEKYWELYSMGLDDQSIAELCKVTRSGVCKWRKKHGLPPHKGKLSTQE